MFYFHPHLGKIPILINIFQMGWNHQPEIDVNHDTVDGRNPAITTWDVKNPLNDGMN